MQLNEALSIVQQQFIAEAQDQEPEGVRDQYHAAQEKYPAMMTVAHHVWAQELIRQNLMQAQQQAQQAQQAGQAPPTG